MEESLAVEQLLCCKQSIMSERKTKHAAENKQQALGIWLMGFLQQTSQVWNREPRSAPAARWEKAAFQTVTNSVKEKPSRPPLDKRTASCPLEARNMCLASKWQCLPGRQEKLNSGL